MILNDIHPNAKIGKDVKIDNFTTICDDVEIGDGTWVGPNVTIFPGARIGKNCKIFPGSVIAAVPQDLKFAGEYTTVEIGDNNVIRECCTINRGTAASGKTVIGNGNLLMAYVHIAHDCVVGDHVITQGGALIDKDIPPFVKGARYPIQYCGVNSLGLQRRGFSTESINRIADIYRYIFVKGIPLAEAVEQVKEKYGNTDEGKQILAFIGSANTGLMSGFRSVRKGE